MAGSYENTEPPQKQEEIHSEVETQKQPEVKTKVELLQGNLVKDLPKEEKPAYKSSWGSPGGAR